MDAETEQLTTLLKQWGHGDQDAGQHLMSAAYSQLRRLAAHYLRRERPDHTLQATALVNELYIKLFGQERIDWQDRAHFFAIAAQQLRRILIDHARKVSASKRGGKRVRLSLTDVNGLSAERDQDLLELDEALHALDALDPRAAKVVEMRFFGGLNETEIADVLDISVTTVRRDWKIARAWLISRLTGVDQSGRGNN